MIRVPPESESNSKAGSEAEAEFEDGPFETNTWPERLIARVVSPAPAPRVHGYDVEEDLARHYSFAEVILLALTGAAPDRAAGRAFEVALLFLGPVSVDEAPVHAAVLGRMCGTSASGALGAGAIALAEQARFSLVRRKDLFSWLDAPEGPIPETEHASTEEERASVRRLRAALDENAPSCPALSQDLNLEAALLSLLHGCGLKTLEQLEAALVIARLPFLASEAFAAGPKDLREYPMCLPRFRYTEEEEEVEGTKIEVAKIVEAKIEETREG